MSKTFWSTVEGTYQYRVERDNEGCFSFESRFMDHNGGWSAWLIVQSAEGALPAMMDLLVHLARRIDELEQRVQLGDS